MPKVASSAMSSVANELGDVRAVTRVYMYGCLQVEVLPPYKCMCPVGGSFRPW